MTIGRLGGTMRPRPWQWLLAIMTLLAACLAAPAIRGHASATCPPEGTGPTARSRALNRLKNRDTAPAPAQVAHAITLAAIVAPGPDKSRFTSQQGAIVEAYVDTVYVGGVESANCEAKTPVGRDTHIEISLDP